MPEIPTNIRHCMLHEFQLGNMQTPLPAISVLYLVNVQLLIVRVVIGLKDFKKVIYRWKIIQDLGGPL